jgi:lipid-binding SYLF domain-containing protein
MRAKILSYSRARGVFAGVSLAGSTIRPDNSANKKLYGRKITARDIALSGEMKVPASAKPLVSELNQATRQHKV